LEEIEKVYREKVILKVEDREMQLITFLADL